MDLIFSRLPFIISLKGDDLMKKIRRILAACGALLLLAMYGSTLFFALTDHSQTAGLLKASLVCTVVIPVLLYAYTLVYRNLQNGRPREEEEGGTEDPGNTQT